MKITLRGPVLAAALLVSFPLMAQEDEHMIEGYVSNDAFQGRYTRPMDVDMFGRAEVGAAVFFNEDRDLVAMATALAPLGRDDRFPRFELRVGPRIYAAFLNIENEDVMGMALGGEARYYLGPESGSAIVLEAYYAPDILVFGTANNVKDVTVRFEMGLRANTAFFVGYRGLKIDTTTGGTRDLDDAVHVGIRGSF